MSGVAPHPIALDLWFKHSLSPVPKRAKINSPFRRNDAEGFHLGGVYTRCERSGNTPELPVSVRFGKRSNLQCRVHELSQRISVQLPKYMVSLLPVVFS